MSKPKRPQLETIETVMAELHATPPGQPFNLMQRFTQLRQQAQQAQRCPSCGGTVDPAQFRDECSRREFQLSGFCQPCQDKFFGA